MRQSGSAEQKHRDSEVYGRTRAAHAIRDRLDESEFPSLVRVAISIRILLSNAAGVKSRSKCYSLRSLQDRVAEMLDKKTLGAIALLIGIVILLQSLFADGTGVGSTPDFGRDQMMGSIAGAILTAVGLYLMVREK